MLSTFRRMGLPERITNYDAMLDDFLNRLEMGATLPSVFGEFSLPDMEVKEDKIIIRLPLAGYGKEDISLEIENDLLHVRAERGMSEKGEKAVKAEQSKQLRSERILDSFFQSIRLPEAVHAHQASASYVDGILTVTIPRDGNSDMQSHQIQVL